MPDKPTAEEYEEITATWEQFQTRQQMAEQAGTTTEEQEKRPGPDTEGGEDEPADASGAAGVTMRVNEREAATHQDREEEFQEQLDPGDDKVGVDSVQEGVFIHYDAEDHDTIMEAKAHVMDKSVGSMWDFFAQDADPPESHLSDIDGYDRLWKMDLRTDQPFGPFSPTNFDVADAIEYLEGRVQHDVLIESDVFEVE
jgi:hypothetical protein